jgi:hypothetical protein
MIDRPARDWMANLIERALTGSFDPPAAYNIDPSPHLKSKDPLIPVAMAALKDFHDVSIRANGTGGASVVANLDPASRQMRVLVTYLHSDLAYDNPGWPAVGCGALFILIASLVLLAAVAVSTPSGEMILYTLAYMGACAIPLLILLTLVTLVALLTFAAFAWPRRGRRPKLGTDITSHWPFDSYAALQAERARQQAALTSSPS